MKVPLKRLSMASVALATLAVSVCAQEARIGDLVGHAADGKKLYRRYCIGCHGPLGDGNGENAQWIDPKPRDFVAGTFKCRSTPTGPCQPTKISTIPSHVDLRIRTCRIGMP